MSPQCKLRAGVPLTLSLPPLPPLPVFPDAGVTLNPTYYDTKQAQAQAEADYAEPAALATGPSASMAHVQGHGVPKFRKVEPGPSAATHSLPAGTASAPATIAGWLGRSLSKAETVSALLGAGLGPGSFCCRNGSTGTVLCVLLDAANVGHFRVVERADKQIELPDIEPCAGMAFPTIADALSHLRANPINTRLKLKLVALAPVPGPTATEA